MLRTDTIYVWQVKLDAAYGLSPAELAHWRSLLSEEEKQRADAFHHAEHRLDYLTSHVALRVVLSRCLGIRPDKVDFARKKETGAKPAVVSNLADVRFNLSHTRGQALIGVTVGCELGIDIEWHRPLEDLDAMARMVMSDTELAIWQELKPEERDRAFYNLWTRKESYLKAIGLGLYRDLHDVTVPVSAKLLDSLQQGGSPIADRSGEGLWRVTDIPAPDAYSASVCWEGTVFPELVLRDLIRDGAAWLA